MPITLRCLQKHARSEKLLKEGRLKLMLNDDGEIEGETAAESRAAAAVSEEVLLFILEHAE